MAWRRKPKVYDLTPHLANEELLKGLSVEAVGMTVGELFEFNERLKSIRVLNGNFAPEHSESVHWAYAELAKRIVEWDYVDDDDEPVPADLDGIKSLGHEEAWRLLEVWLMVLSGVPAPLENESTSGERSGVESLPMETLSESPPS